MTELPKRLLIANRGEIAVRVARTAREMGIDPIGVFAESDAGAFHVRQMSQAVSLGAGSPLETYLSSSRLLEAARRARADAVHPGYGFLSENAAFAREVEASGLMWIGPPASAMEEMGDKLRARHRMREAGVLVVPGSDASAGEDQALLQKGNELGFPLFVKAAAGGGGKGMSRVGRPEDLPAALAETRRVAKAAFGDDRVYLEKLLERPRHIEFQVFGDRSGNIVHLFERECSVQRRHQKLLEETPSVALDSRLRGMMGRAAVEAARSVGYVGAGTVEFLLDERGNFYFLEMNTRLQVEHPITEETLRVDLVRAQIEIAAGTALPASWRAGKLYPQGHAIELRLYAEDPIESLPRSGVLLAYEEPSGPGVRVDAGVEKGSRIGLDYDPLLAKLVISAPDRPAAIARARRALCDWVVLGLETNLPLLASVLASKEFVSGRYATDLLERLPRPAPAQASDAAWIAAALCLSGPGEEAGAGQPRDPWNEASGWRLSP
ncbi:MAG TPA: biotin carboxylase N-terminal domain-containing protein [Thermoanaerobaculia bacterium]|nr:biotin carboxylase N-terminal domain-containing protein [Thermoanaerobaculia bacterium]